MEIPGDVMIGGIFNIHDAEDASPFQCSDIKVREGFQYTEALRYAIEMVNKVRALRWTLERNQNLLQDSSNSLQWHFTVSFVLLFSWCATQNVSFFFLGWRSCYITQHNAWRICSWWLF